MTPKARDLLDIGTDFGVPLDLVTQRGAILGRTGAGKSYTLRVIVEALSAAGLPVVVLDPMGAFYGLRSSADGKKAGIAITILGGEHADLPLEPTAGALVADVVVEHPGAYIIDLSSFDTDADEDRFAEAFAHRLFRAKAKSKAPMCLIVDEADRFAPQRPYKGQERMLGAFNTLSRRGRQRGLGLILATQRPASLNKHALTQSELLIVHQVTGPQDRDAIDEWVRLNGSKEQREEFLSSLSTLERGEAWLWSPSWLREFRRVRIRKARTFDSSKTPEPGDVVVEPKQLAPVELEKLRKRMAATIEKAKADDPKEMRKTIRELERTIKLMSESIAKAPAPEPVEVKVAVLDDELVARVETAAAELVDKIGAGFLELAKVLEPIGSEVRTRMEGCDGDPGVRLRSVRGAGNGQRDPARVGDVPSRGRRGDSAGVGGTRAPAVRRAPEGRAGAPVVRGRNGDGGPRLGAGELRTLIAAAQHEDGVTRPQLTVLTGYKRATRNTYLQRLGAAGLIEVSPDGRIFATAEGTAALGEDFEPLPVGAALRDKYLRELPAGERAIFAHLIDAWPNGLTRDELTERTEYSRATRNTYIQRMSAKEIVDVRGSSIFASERLFEGGG